MNNENYTAFVFNREYTNLALTAFSK